MATRYPDTIVVCNGMRRKITTVATTYTVLLTDDIIVSNGAAPFTITLPPAASAYDAATGTGSVFQFINTDTDDVTIEGDGAETINGAANVLLDVQFERLCVVSDGTQWLIVSL
jgi:DNA-binding beta-propeller fold protein YncE